MLLGGNLFTAPVAARLQEAGFGVRRPRVLDLGTGTGIWAIDVADLFENAEVLANDLSPIQPSNVPLNVRFEVDDVESRTPPCQPIHIIQTLHMHRMDFEDADKVCTGGGIILVNEIEMKERWTEVKVSRGRSIGPGSARFSWSFHSGQLARRN